MVSFWAKLITQLRKLGPSCFLCSGVSGRLDPVLRPWKMGCLAVHEVHCINFSWGVSVWFVIGSFLEKDHKSSKIIQHHQTSLEFPNEHLWPDRFMSRTSKLRIQLSFANFVARWKLPGQRWHRSQRRSPCWRPRRTRGRSGLVSTAERNGCSWLVQKVLVIAS